MIYSKLTRKEMTQKLAIDFRELPTYGVLLAEVPTEIMDVLNQDIDRMLKEGFDKEFDYTNSKTDF